MFSCFMYQISILSIHQEHCISRFSFQEHVFQGIFVTIFLPWYEMEYNQSSF